jgi:hypothetical protein
VKEKINLWRLYNQATAYGKRASDFFRLETEIGEWYLNEACLMIGRKFENMLNEGKQPFTESGAGKQKYRSAATTRMRRVKINANGTW